MTKTEFIKELHRIGAIKFGSFVLKSGITSPFYLNLRLIVSHPQLLKSISSLITQSLPLNISYDHLVGVPYAGIPIASCLAVDINKPLLIPRKEEKAYGSKDAIIGEFAAGEKCLIIEDIITSGESILETADNLKNHGLKIAGAFVVIDRRADQDNFESRNGFPLFALFNIEEVVSVLFEDSLISKAQKEEINEFLKSSAIPASNEDTLQFSNTLTEKLSTLMGSKQTRLVLSLDVEDSNTFFDILEKTGNEIALLKTHIDILKDFEPSFITRLREMSQKHNFLIFEDRKFADIGNTVRHQYQGGVYNISDWAEFVTVHMIAGEHILNGLFDNIQNRSSFLLAKMSAKNNLISENYTRKVLEIGKKYSSVVSGFIGHGANAEEIAKLKKKIPKGFLLLMPGVQIDSKGDSLGQTYLSPESAIKGGADAIIVGRGITHSSNPLEAAKRYREASII